MYNYLSAVSMTSKAIYDLLDKTGHQFTLEHVISSLDRLECRKDANDLFSVGTHIYISSFCNCFICFLYIFPYPYFMTCGLVPNADSSKIIERCRNEEVIWLLFLNNTFKHEYTVLLNSFIVAGWLFCVKEIWRCCFSSFQIIVKGISILWNWPGAPYTIFVHTR